MGQVVYGGRTLAKGVSVLKDFGVVAEDRRMHSRSLAGSFGLSR
jgi:hypothetical protein